MNTQIKQIDNAIRAVRKEMLKALEKASNKCVAIFPDADKDPETAHLVLNILTYQVQESFNLFFSQFALSLDASLSDHWLQNTYAEIDEYIKELEAGV